MKKTAVLLVIISIYLLPSGLFPQPKDAKEKDAKGTGSEKKSATGITDGYGTLKWGTLLNDVKKGITGKIYYTDDRQVIISRDGEMEYRYGFFFDDARGEGRFFYLSLGFPYLSLDEVKNRLETKFGKPTGETVIKNQGALAWDSDKTLIILWVDNYENKPFSRRITYLGKEIARELNEFQKKAFNKTELEIIKKLNP